VVLKDGRRRDDRADLAVRRGDGYLGDWNILCTRDDRGRIFARLSKQKVGLPLFAQALHRWEHGGRRKLSKQIAIS
jgi:hypothetical protein